MSKIYGPWMRNHVEKVEQQRIEQLNLRRLYVQINIGSKEENLKQKRISSHR